MPSCIICYEEKEGTIVCAEGHATCKECLAPFVAINADALSKTDLIASMADAAAARKDTAAVAKFEGRCLCPLFGHGCNAGPFEDKDVAAHVPPGVFCAFVGSKVHLPLARKLQDVVAKKQELSLQFPNARQCGRCSHGPVLFRGCSDLTTHHGQGGIDNSCGRCGWFAPHISMWPRWDPTAAALGRDDPLDAVFSEAQEDEPAAAARAEERRRQAALFRQQQEAREEERRQWMQGMVVRRRAAREARMVSMEERRALRDDGWGVAQQLPSGERRWHDFDSRPPSWRRQQEPQEPQEPPRQRRRVVDEGEWPPAAARLEPRGLPGRFEPASAFAGARPGYVFRSGEQGLGYYPDGHITRGHSGLLVARVPAMAMPAGGQATPRGLASLEAGGRGPAGPTVVDTGFGDLAFADLLVGLGEHASAGPSGAGPSGVGPSGEPTEDEEQRALRAYEAYFDLPDRSATIDQVRATSAGVAGFARFGLGRV